MQPQVRMLTRAHMVSQEDEAHQRAVMQQRRDELFESQKAAFARRFEQRKRQLAQMAVAKAQAAAAPEVDETVVTTTPLPKATLANVSPKAKMEGRRTAGPRYMCLMGCVNATSKDFATDCNPLRLLRSCHEQELQWRQGGTFVAANGGFVAFSNPYRQQVYSKLRQQWTGYSMQAAVCKHFSACLGLCLQWLVHAACLPLLRSEPWHLDITGWEPALVHVSNYCVDVSLICTHVIESNGHHARYKQDEMHTAYSAIPECCFAYVPMRWRHGLRLRINTGTRLICLQWTPQIGLRTVDTLTMEARQRRAKGSEPPTQKFQRYTTPRMHGATKRSCPGLNPRGGGSGITGLTRRLFIVSLVQPCLSPVTGVRVGSVPTALPEAQNNLIRNQPITCAKPSGSFDFSGPYLGVVRKRAYKRACDRAALRGGNILQRCMAYS